MINAKWEIQKLPLFGPPKKTRFLKKSTTRGTSKYHSSLPSLCRERIIDLFF
jgi:hypothetical protein